jgi:hypothetical protein
VGHVQGRRSLKLGDILGERLNDILVERFGEIDVVQGVGLEVGSEHPSAKFQL